MSRQTMPLARTTDLIVQPLDRETIIYDGATHKAYVLNSTAAAVWHACNGKRSVAELAAHLSKDTPIPEQVVWYALGQVNDLLEEPLTLPPELAGVSRRKFLKMSGAVAAGVVIPSVVKLLAPTPAQAQSAGNAVCCVCTNGTTATFTGSLACDKCDLLCTLSSGSVASCTCT